MEEVASQVKSLDTFYEKAYDIMTSAKAERWEEGAFAAAVSEPGAKVTHAWFRGGWWDPLTMAWKDVAGAACYDRAPVTEGGHSPGATLFVRFRVGAGESKTIALRPAWFVGQTNLRVGKDAPGTTPDPSQPQQFRPWYAGRFTDINSVSFFWRDHFAELRQKSARFSDCFYDTSLPGEVVEAVAANLAILKSPTRWRVPRRDACRRRPRAVVRG